MLYFCYIILITTFRMHKFWSRIRAMDDWKDFEKNSEKMIVEIEHLSAQVHDVPDRWQKYFFR